MAGQREHWGSKLGVILAVAGSAVGLGNFLRYPAKMALNGGGAFMIPYLVAFLLLGIPLMWMEWTLGRMGGQRGFGTATSIFASVTRNSMVARILGAIGILGPFIILVYYTFIESWTLAYAYFAFTGELTTMGDQAGMKAFLSGYQGLVANEHFSGIGIAYIFFMITFSLNFFFIYRGIQGGIEKLSRIGMPILLILAVLLVIRTLSLGTPDPAQPELSITNALNFIYTPDLASLGNAKVWLEAAGQIFFTLSIGMGVIIAYASYLKKDDDVVLSGLSAASTNEFCEVILGGSVVIPAAFVFLGAAGTMEVAKSGLFNIGFVTMPLIFGKIPLGALFAGVWFLLLFIAGITSSVSMVQPAMSFLQDELKVDRKKATGILGIIAFLACQPAIFFLGHGFVDELDFWGGTVFLVLFATVETVIFGWVIGIDKAWEEMHQGADIRIPSAYKFIIKYVTPLYLFAILGAWSYQQFIPTILMEGIAEVDKPYIWGARLLVFGGLAAVIALTVYAARRMKNDGAAGGAA